MDYAKGMVDDAIWAIGDALGIKEDGNSCVRSGARSSICAG
jgi:hypothetical protein